MRSTLFSQTTADGKRNCITAVMRRSSVHSKQRRELQRMCPQIRVAFLMVSHSWCEHVAEQLFQRIQGAKDGRSAVTHRRHDKGKHSASVFVQAARSGERLRVIYLELKLTHLTAHRNLTNCIKSKQWEREQHLVQTGEDVNPPLAHRDNERPPQRK